MIRFLLWALLFFIVYRIIKAFTSGSFGGWSRGERKPTSPSEPTYRDIEEAKFEDVKDEKEDKT